MITREYRGKSDKDKQYVYQLSDDTNHENVMTVHAIRDSSKTILKASQIESLYILHIHITFR